MTLLAIRPGERRDAWAAFATLFGLIASHSILETARDALFLAKVPTSHLPWVFLAVAALSFVVVRLRGVVGGRLEGRPALALSTLISAAITFAFFALFDRLGPFGLYALYVWSGLLTSLLLVHFWTLVGNLFSVTQAKRLYGFIGAGSVLGAIAGSGAASALARAMPAQKLLVVSAVGFAVTAGVPFLFRSTTTLAAAPVASPTTPATGQLATNLKYVRESPYARRVVAVLLVSTIALTLSDFVFKSMVAQLVPAARLGQFLGTLYFALNIASLLCQLLFVGRLLKRASLGATLALLPVLLALGGVGVALTGGLGSALALKSVDGSLRYSLHRTASELLYLPFSDEARKRVKAFMDVLGQRGGQIVASLALLAFGAIPGVSPRALAVVLIVTAGAWAFAALSLREPYIELFRARLKTSRLSHLEEFPELDVASLETLIATLDSPRDNEVVAALHVLEREAKTHLVPALILYHPSELVVERALGLFTRAHRINVVPVIDRLLDHPSPRVRAATIAARSILAPDAQALLLRMSLEESSEVRATITVNLIASGEIYGDDAKERIDAILRRGATTTKIALVEAVAGRDAKGFDEVLVTLAAAPEPELQRAAVAAMARLAGPVFLSALIGAIAGETTREDALKALANYGATALEALQNVLETPGSAPAMRWRIPNAMTYLEPHAAGAALLAWLPRETEGSVRFQIIRALEKLVRRTPDLVLDGAVLQGVIDQTVQRARSTLEARVALERGLRTAAWRRTAGHDLLRTTLHHKEKNAIERLFRLLGLAHPKEDFGQIYRGLQGSRDQRATSTELLDNILVDPLRISVRSLVDDLPDEERLRQSQRHHALLALGYEALLAELGASDSEAVRDIATFHERELATGAMGAKRAADEAVSP